VSSTGPAIHAKHFALSYDFDLLRVFPRCLEYISTTLYPKSSQGECCGTLILARVLERFSPVNSRYSRFKSPVPESFVFGSRHP
jgi:hypothetical protein